MIRITQFAIPAPEFPPFRKRATGKLQTVKPWLNGNDRLDGIVDAGLLTDDAWRHVTGPDMRHGGIGPVALVIIIAQEGT